MMKRYSIQILLILLFTLSFYSCYYDNEEYMYPQTGSCDTTNVTFTSSVKPILTNNCYSCHSNSNSALGAGIKLEDYEGVKHQVDIGRLLGSVKHSDGFFPMPKNGVKLNDCNISIIEKWINSGAQNN